MKLSKENLKPVAYQACRHLRTIVSWCIYDQVGEQVWDQVGERVWVVSDIISDISFHITNQIYDEII